MRTTWCLVLVVLLGPVSTGLASSSILDPACGWGASDRVATGYFTGYDVYGSTVVGWQNGSLKVLDVRTGDVLRSLGTPGPGYLDGSAFNSFVRKDPADDAAWVGFTYVGGLGDRIYRVDYATGTWTHRATLAGNFDMEFAPGGLAYVSGTGSTAGNSLWLLDASGADDHDLIADVGGFSAGLGFDAAGNLYYASGFGGGGGLVRYSAAQVAGAIGPGSLAWGDAEWLSDTAYDAYDVAADAGGNVFFNGNAYDFVTGLTNNYVAAWNGTAGAGLNYNVLATGAGVWGNWLTFLDAGEAGEGTAYCGDFYEPGIALLVPEPVTMFGAILGVGSLGAYVRRRARRRPGMWT